VKLRIGTRGSRLDLAQSNLIAAPLRALGVEVELVPIRTSGDRLAQVALADFRQGALREGDQEPPIGASTWPCTA
jgi:porphobilinogen deaminase